MTLKIMPIIGTRPEAIKMAPVIKALEKDSENFETIVCATGQHQEMLEQVLQLFDITPAYDLKLMRPNQSLSQLTARILIGVDELILRERPDWILVQGDTTTVMAASLVAFYHGVQIGHVEAGLRTNDKRHPFPEEVNRRITDLYSDLYFAPTHRNRENLLREGVNPKAIIVTGNTVIDALLMTVERLEKEPITPAKPPVDALPSRGRLILVTAHRRENFGQPLNQICQALKMIAMRYPNDKIIYPVHLNPYVWNPVHELLGNLPNISLIAPVSYDRMVGLMKDAYLILSDSGGLQEEAPSLNKPLLVLRETTERPEAVSAGAIKLVGTDEKIIVRETIRLLDNPVAYQEMAAVPNPYGDGQASQRIIQAILAHHSP